MKKPKPVMEFRAPDTSRVHSSAGLQNRFVPCSCQENCGRLTGIGSSEENQQNVMGGRLAFSVSIPRDWRWFSELFTVTQGYSDGLMLRLTAFSSNSPNFSSNRRTTWPTAIAMARQHAIHAWIRENACCCSRETISARGSGQIEATPPSSPSTASTAQRVIGMERRLLRTSPTSQP